MIDVTALAHSARLIGLSDDERRRTWSSLELQLARPLELSILGLIEIETGREPFEPWLERLARRSDVVGDAARAVRARWYGS